MKATALKVDIGFVVGWSTLFEVRQGYRSMLRPEGSMVDRFTSVLLPPLGYLEFYLKLLLVFFLLVVPST